MLANSTEKGLCTKFRGVLIGFHEVVKLQSFEFGVWTGEAQQSYHSIKWLPSNNFFCWYSLIPVYWNLCSCKYDENMFCFLGWYHAWDFLKITNSSDHDRVWAGSEVREKEWKEIFTLLCQGCVMVVHMLILFIWQPPTDLGSSVSWYYFTTEENQTIPTNFLIPSCSIIDRQCQLTTKTKPWTNMF